MMREKNSQIPGNEITLKPYQSRKELSRSFHDVLITSPRLSFEVHRYHVARQTWNETPCRLTDLDLAHHIGRLTSPIVRLTTDRFEHVSEVRRTLPTRCHVSDDDLCQQVRRVDLNSVDMAHKLHQLIVDHGYTQQQLADHIDKSRSTIANYLRLLTLPQKVSDALRKDEISMGHAKVILSLHSEQEQLDLFDKIQGLHLSVRQAERVAKPNKDKPSPPYLDQMKALVEKECGMKVSVGAKQVAFHYQSTEQLTQLLKRLGIDENGHPPSR